jgi:hypothetical protein
MVHVRGQREQWIDIREIPAMMVKLRELAMRGILFIKHQGHQWRGEEVHPMDCIEVLGPLHSGAHSTMFEEEDEKELPPIDIPPIPEGFGLDTDIRDFTLPDDWLDPWAGPREQEEVTLEEILGPWRRPLREQIESPPSMQTPPAAPQSYDEIMWEGIRRDANSPLAWKAIPLGKQEQLRQNQKPLPP